MQDALQRTDIELAPRRAANDSFRLTAEVPHLFVKSFSWLRERRFTRGAKEKLRATTFFQ
jgi:hypothetical protein